MFNNIKNLFKEQNRNFLRDSTDIYQAVQTLSDMGCEVEKIICKKHRTPRIWLKHTGHCNKLDGAAKIRGSDESGRYRIIASSLNQCEINWIVRGAA